MLQQCLMHTITPSMSALLKQCVRFEFKTHGC